MLRPEQQTEVTQFLSRSIPFKKETYPREAQKLPYIRKFQHMVTNPVQVVSSISDLCSAGPCAYTEKDEGRFDA